MVQHLEASHAHTTKVNLESDISQTLTSFLVRDFYLDQIAIFFLLEFLASIKWNYF